MPDPNVIKKVSSFINECNWESFPDAVKQKALFCWVDNLSAIISGTATRYSDISTQFALKTWPGDEAAIVCKGKKAGVLGAAFANGAAANGVDSDDSARYAYGHAGAQVSAVSLTLGQALDKSGSRMLAAMVTGYEIAHRVGGCWHDQHEIYQACGSWGTVACAAAAANLYNLSPEHCWEALGIAEYHSPNAPMMRDIAHPGMVKHAIHWSPMAGIMAAQLAMIDFTGMPCILDLPEYHNWSLDIGEHFHIVDGVAWKRKGNACCGWAQGATRGAIKLKKEHNINPSDIRSILIQTFSDSTALGTNLPRTTEQAQFNLGWPVAAALVDGEVGPAQMSLERLKDPAIIELVSKIEVKVTEEMEELLRLFKKGDSRGSFSSKVFIELKNGNILKSGPISAGIAFPPEPAWSKEEMSEKFTWLTEPVIGRGKTKKILDLAWNTHKLSKIKEVISALEE